MKAECAPARNARGANLHGWCIAQHIVNRALALHTPEILAAKVVPRNMKCARGRKAIGDVFIHLSPQRATAPGNCQPRAAREDAGLCTCKILPCQTTRAAEYGGPL